LFKYLLAEQYDENDRDTIQAHKERKKERNKQREQNKRDKDVVQLS
jgi:hypothetical protein